VPPAKKIRVPSAEWDSTGWTCLKFSMSEPQFYSYQHESNGALGTAAAYTATALGDLDGDSETSRFELTAHGGPLGDAVRDTFRVINEDE
jgi:hypothetical protein